MREIVNRVRSHPWIVGRPGLWQFIKFGLVGGVNTVVDFSVYLLLTRLAGWFYLASNITSFLVAVMVSYFLNKYWTFRGHTRAALPVQLGKFLIVSTVGAALSSCLLYLGVKIVALPDVWVKVLAIGLVMFWNFFANKYWTFRQSVE